VSQPLEVRAVNREAVDSRDGISWRSRLRKAGAPGENGDPTGNNKTADSHFKLLD
jgi:hypothetical protein